MGKLTRNGLTHQQVSCDDWSNPRIKIYKCFLKVSLLVTIKKMLIEIVNPMGQFRLDHGMFPRLVFLRNYFMAFIRNRNPISGAYSGPNPEVTWVFRFFN